MQSMTGAWSSAMSAAGAATAPVEDKRFGSDAWSKDPRFDAVRRMYLAYADFIEKAIEATPIDEREKGQLRFAGRQFVDAMSPANFFVTNPEAIKIAMETGGQSVSDGMKRFFEDFAKGRITTTDEKQFEVGRNIAVTPGSVVYENELMQLVQYAPTTDKVYERPLVIVPPCINKFYILDLQPENSFVANAVAHGHTVFMVSWRNVKPDLGTRTWDDYLKLGPMKAIDVALEITGADQANTLGFCIGGTLLASSAAVMKTNEEERIASMTLLTSMLDFSDTGEIGLLITERAVESREAAIGKGGLLQGKELGFVFSSLRANDLIWPYVVNSYLKGRGRPRSICSTGTPTRPTCRVPCSAGMCAHVPEERTARAGQDRAMRRAASTWATSTAPRTSTPRGRTTSCRGRRRTSRRGSLEATTDLFSAPAATSRRHQPADEEQAQLLDGRPRGQRCRSVARGRAESSR
jgi:polyhydroxyalkanoate synthase